MQATTDNWTSHALETYDTQVKTIHPAIQDELELHVLRDLLVRFSELPLETVQPLEQHMNDLLDRMTTKGLDGISRRRGFKSLQEEFYALVVKQLKWKEAGSIITIGRIAGPLVALVIEVIARWLKLWDSGFIFFLPMSLFFGGAVGQYLEKRLACQGRLFGEVPESY